jgi:hypothetical protein
MLNFSSASSVASPIEVNDNMFILFDIKTTVFSTVNKRKYVPRKNSAPYAIVITLYRYDFVGLLP